MTETSTDHEGPSVEFEQLNAVKEGDRIAVQAVDGTTTILIGTVTNRLFENPGEEDPRLRPTVEVESNFSTTFLSVEYASIYEIVDG